MIRRAAVTGQFYPSEKLALEKILGQVCVNQKTIEVEVRMLVAPHAGIMYSGKTAGKGYACLKGKKFKWVILLGVSHQGGFRGAVADASQVWETPLGRVEVDHNVANQITGGQLISKDTEPHRLEHSLEMQLIFLQYVLKPGFKIMPILLGAVRDQDIKNIGIKIRQIITPEALLVISSDLSHYPESKLAADCDQQVIAAFCGGNPVQFLDKVNKLERVGYSNYLSAACGSSAMAAGLYTAKTLGQIKLELIDYSHSGMITGDNSQVVGYASIGGVDVR